MPSPKRAIDRRAFLALCGTAAVAGCGGAPGSSDPSTTNGAETTTDATTQRPTQTEVPREARPGSWSSFGYDASNAGHNRDSGAVPKSEESWSTFVPGYFTLPTPAVSNIGVYMGSKSSMFAMDRATGFQVWSERLGPYTHTFTPAIADETVYAVSRGLAGADSGSNTLGTIVAVDERTGAADWRTRALISSSPTVADDTLYHAAAGRTTAAIVARSTADGSETWRFSLADGGTAGAFGTPAVVDGTVYATGWIATDDGSDGVLYALDPATGEERWRQTVPETLNIAPIVGGGMIVLAGADGTVYAVSIDDEEVVWTRSVGDGVYARPAIGPEHVYTVTEGTLTALETTDGSVDWTAPVGESHFSEIAVAGGGVFVGGNVLYAYNAADGSERWHREVPGYAGAWGGPAIVDGDMYVGVCIKPEAGDLYDNYVYYMDG